MAEAPTRLEYDEAKAWAEGWEARKTKMLGKLAKKKGEWKERATSDEAEVKYAVEVVKAVKEKRRKKGLEKISPEEWYNKTVDGTLSKTITDEEIAKWDRNSAPYREFVRQASDMLKAKGYSGVELAQLWAKLVLPKLQKAKRNPNIIPRLLSELRAEIERLPPAKIKEIRPEAIEITIGR